MRVVQTLMGSLDPEREELEARLHRYAKHCGQALAESVELEAGVLVVKALEEPEEV